MIQGTLCILLSIQQFIFNRYACAIPDEDNEELIITGGYDTMTTVSVYNETGWQRDLAPLNQGRGYHACVSYVNGGKKVNHIELCLKVTFSCQFLMVSGGWTGSADLDSTEIFSDNTWRTVAGKLPEPMSSLRVTTINNRVLSLGN